MTVIRRKLTGAVTLNVIATDKFKTDFLSVAFIAPLKKEDAASNALMMRVLTRGSAKYPTMTALSRRMDELYDADISKFVSKRGEMQLFGFNCRMLKNAYAIDGTNIQRESIALLGEMLFDPYLENGAFKNEYVESEKRNLINDINAQIDNKDYYAVMRCRQLMCESEAYGLPENGSPEDVGPITSAALYEHYKKAIRSCQVEIYFIGSCDIDSLAASLTATFEKLGTITPQPYATEVRRTCGGVREFTDRLPVEQGKLTLGFRTGTVLSDGDYHVFTAFCELFGASPTSKLFMNVREKLSLCYYCSAMPESLKGVMIVASGIEAKNKEMAQAEILKQLEDVKNGVVSDDELNAAKKSLVNAYRTIYDSPSALENWYLGRMFASLSDSPEDCAEKVLTVTKEQISAAAKKLKLDTVYFLCPEADNGGKKDE